MGYIRSLCCLTLVLTACAADDEAPVPAFHSGNNVPVVVETVLLTPENHAPLITTFGVVEGLEDVDIAAEMSGTVTRVIVREGDAVAAGDVLLELNDEKAEYKLTQARQAAEQASVLLDEARLRYQRRQDLAESDTISKEDLDSARLRLLAVDASHQKARAALQLAERELADASVRSPSDGLVDQRFIEPGEPVTMGTPLLSLQVVHTMRVHTWVSEADVFSLRAGNKAKVTLSGLPQREFEAVVAWVGVNADAATGNFPVKLLLQDESDRIRPGMTATAHIEGLEIDDMLVLPESALVDRDRRRVVFVAVREDDKTVARLREPRLAAGFANRLVVLAGVVVGERVIVSNQAQLTDGRGVELAP